MDTFMIFEMDGLPRMRHVLGRTDVNRNYPPLLSIPPQPYHYVPRNATQTQAKPAPMIDMEGLPTMSDILGETNAYPDDHVPGNNAASIIWISDDEEEQPEQRTLATTEEELICHENFLDCVFP